MEGIASLGHSGEGFQTQGFSGEFQNSSCQLGTLSAWRHGKGGWSLAAPQAAWWILGLPSGPLGPRHSQLSPGGLQGLSGGGGASTPQGRTVLGTEKVLGVGAGWMGLEQQPPQTSFPSPVSDKGLKAEGAHGCLRPRKPRPALPGEGPSSSVLPLARLAQCFPWPPGGDFPQASGS